MAKNIEMNVLNENGSYEVVYPKSLSSNMIVSSEIVSKYGLSDNTMESLIDTIGKPQQSGFYMDKETVYLERLGENWSQVQSSGYAWHYVLGNEDGSKLVGVNITSNNWYSTDKGVTWTAVKGPDTYNDDFNTLYYLNGIWYGHRFNKGKEFEYSTDGINFKYITFDSTPSGDVMDFMAIKDGVGYIVAKNGESEHSSGDGKNYNLNIYKTTSTAGYFQKVSSITMHSVNSTFYGFHYIGGKFLLIGYYEAKVSTNLTTWTTSNFYPKKWSLDNSSVYSSKIGDYIYMTAYQSSASYFTSDGVNTTSVPSATSKLFASTGGIAGSIRNFNAVEIAGILYAAGYKSTDRGRNWTKLFDGVCGVPWWDEERQELRCFYQTIDGRTTAIYNSKENSYLKTEARIYTTNEFEQNGFMSSNFYTGTGTYGASNPNSWTFERQPRIVFISGTYLGIFTIDKVKEKVVGYVNGSTALNCSYDWATNKLTWYNKTNVNNQLNTSGNPYCIYAIY